VACSQLKADNFYLPIYSIHERRRLILITFSAVLWFYGPLLMLSLETITNDSVTFSLRIRVIRKGTTLIQTWSV